MFEIALLGILAFVLEMIDNGLGGGFGTILAPLLIILGYDPKVIVPAILVSETISGLWGGGWHLHFHNVNFKAVALTLAGSLIAMVAASYIVGVALPSATIKQYISIMAIGMGLFVVIRSYYLAKLTPKKSRPYLFSLLGFLVGFNKGGSGGNYGPISVTGYMLLGLSGAVAIGTTTVAEGIACLLGVGIYLQFTGIVLAVALPLSVGSFIADPIGAWLNSHLKSNLSISSHSRLIGLVMSSVGTIALLRALGVV
jgi:uncharacterized membrane protein YfcA